MADRDSNSSAIGAVNNKRDEAGVDNTAATQVESNGYYGSSKPVTFWGKLKASLKRFWWAYLLFFLCAVVLAVTLLIFVGVKNIAQGKIDNATLDVLGISCTNTTVDNFTLGINTTLKSGTTKATVGKFKGVMYLEDEPSHRPFVTIDFPEVKNKRFQTVNISQNVQIVDKEALTTFNTWLLSNESLRVTVLGHPKVKVPGISKKYRVTFKKTVTLTGLNGFAGINAYDGSISLSNFTDGTNYHATAEIPNTSVVTFEIVSPSRESFLNRRRLLTTPGQCYVCQLFERRTGWHHLSGQRHPLPRQERVCPALEHLPGPGPQRGPIPALLRVWHLALPAQRPRRPQQRPEPGLLWRRSGCPQHHHRH